MDILTLYTTHCPRCNVLTKKLDQAGLNYNIIDSVEVMITKNISEVPMLAINDGELMNFKEAINWINSLEV